MVRASLDTRLVAIESKMRAELTRLTPEDVDELYVRRRAEGRSDDEVFDELRALDPNHFLGVGCRPAGYSIYDNPLIKLPDAWAAQHSDRFVRLVGQLVEGELCILTHQSDTYRRPLTVRGWEEWDALLLPVLAALSWEPMAWRSYWARRDRGSLLDHYLLLARRAVESFEDENGTEVTEAARQERRWRVQWILATEEEPERIPWHKESAA